MQSLQRATLIGMCRNQLYGRDSSLANVEQSLDTLLMRLNRQPSTCGLSALEHRSVDGANVRLASVDPSLSDKVEVGIGITCR